MNEGTGPYKTNRGKESVQKARNGIIIRLLQSTDCGNTVTKTSIVIIQELATHRLGTCQEKAVCQITGHHGRQRLAVGFQPMIFPCNSGMRMTSKYSGDT